MISPSIFRDWRSPTVAKWQEQVQTNARFRCGGWRRDGRKAEDEILVFIISYIYRIYGAADWRKQTVAPRAFSTTGRKLTGGPLGKLKLDTGSRSAPTRASVVESCERKRRDERDIDVSTLWNSKNRIKSTSILLQYSSFFTHLRYIHKTLSCMLYNNLSVKLKRNTFLINLRLK